IVVRAAPSVTGRTRATRGPGWPCTAVNCSVSQPGWAALEPWPHWCAEEGGEDMRSEGEPERAIEVYGRGVRTALRNNATAYGFSITITVSYGLLSGAQRVVTAAE